MSGISSHEIIDLFLLVADKAWTRLNSNFFTALSGAFAGAFGAQRIIEKTSRKTRLLEEIRSTNAGIMIAFSIFNTVCVVKRQHVRRLVEIYQNQINSLEEYQLQRKLGFLKDEAEFHFEAYFQKLPEVDADTSVLRKIIVEKSSVSRRAIIFESTLSQTIQSLNRAIIKRNEVIDAISKKKDI